MDRILFYTGLVMLPVLGIPILWFSVMNFRRGFKRAGWISIVAACIIGIAALFPPALQITGILLILLLIPLKHKDAPERKPGDRFDERDISFSRQRLKPGSDDYADYYRRYPEKEKRDAATRALPGLMARGSMFYNRMNSAATYAEFSVTEALHSISSGEPFQSKAEESPEEISRYINGWLEYQGFRCRGITAVRDEHYYSHHGRRAENYGVKIPVEHTHAIVIGSKMKEALTGTAPRSPEVVEVAMRYRDSGVAAVETAAFLRSLGYSARAHIDGCYQVIPTLIALDAGLGGFGWSNLFITDMYGSAVRFAAVTTDCELPVLEKSARDYLSFCHHCRKCASHCPSKAINREKIERIKADRCYAYWNASGTDCGVCMAVCPMNHPWGVLKKLALKSFTAAVLLPLLDDLFYGRGKRTSGVPEWMNCR